MSITYHHVWFPKVHYYTRLIRPYRYRIGVLFTCEVWFFFKDAEVRGDLELFGLLPNVLLVYAHCACHNARRCRSFAPVSRIKIVYGVAHEADAARRRDLGQTVLITFVGHHMRAGSYLGPAVVE